MVVGSSYPQTASLHRRRLLPGLLQASTFLFISGRSHNLASTLWPPRAHLTNTDALFHGSRLLISTANVSPSTSAATWSPTGFASLLCRGLLFLVLSYRSKRRHPLLPLAASSTLPPLPSCCYCSLPTTVALPSLLPASQQEGRPPLPSSSIQLLSNDGKLFPLIRSVYLIKSLAIEDDPLLTPHPPTTIAHSPLTVASIFQRLAFAVHPLMSTLATSPSLVVALYCLTIASYIFFWCRQHLLLHCNRNRTTSASSAVATGPPLPTIEVPSLPAPSPLVREASWS
ncbi:hypothetical protein BHM03_00011411 [Ensete ventricosum]|nr:hypothetical protein BHM03_00011411 [Ensete ventricosum]